MPPKNKHPLCAALLKDQSPCLSVAVEAVDGVGYCAGHARKVREAPVAEVIEGPPEPKNLEGAADSVVDDVPEVVDEIVDSPEASLPEPVPVESLRGELRSGLVTSETAILIRDNLLAGLRAFKDFYVSCPSCKHRHPVSAPDLGVRVNAAEKLLDQLEGKLRAESQTVEQKLERAQQKAQSDLESLSDDELALLLVGEQELNDPPHPGALALKLAAALRDDHNADPKGWLERTLTPEEVAFIRGVSSAGHWARYPESLFELAERVLEEAPA